MTSSCFLGSVETGMNLVSSHRNDENRELELCYFIPKLTYSSISFLVRKTNETFHAFRSRY